jgi:hypothetical protein
MREQLKTITKLKQTKELTFKREIPKIFFEIFEILFLNYFLFID